MDLPNYCAQSGSGEIIQSASIQESTKSLLSSFQQSTYEPKHLWAKHSLLQLDALQSGGQLDRVLAWYFLTFCVGWGYGIRLNGGVQTVHRGVELDQLRLHLGLDALGCEPIYLAGRPPALYVPWIALDLDRSSLYHPHYGAQAEFDRLLATLCMMGLVSPITIRSSDSDGIHLWFPLAEVVPTFQSAATLTAVLTQEGFKLANGVLELRPNRKSYKADYLLMRLPLTGEGNEFWLDGFGFCDDLTVFAEQWQRSEVLNTFFLPEHLKQHLITDQVCRQRQRSSSGANHQGLTSAMDRLAEGFTGHGQSQELKLMAQQIARFAEGLDTVQALRKRCQELMMQAPGFDEYCGHQDAIRSGRYWGNPELERLLLLPVGGYEGTVWEKANERRAADARERARHALDLADQQGLSFHTNKAAIAALIELGAPVNSWWTNPRQKDVLAELRDRLVVPAARIHQSRDD